MVVVLVRRLYWLLVSVGFGVTLLTTATVLLPWLPWLSFRTGVLHWSMVPLALLMACLSIVAQAVAVRWMWRLLL
jgi:hypothetical protein